MTPKQLPGEIVSDSFRGVYLRVAKKVKLDASTVSRVANGTRRNVVIEMALREELILVRKTLAEFLMPTSASVLCGDKRRRE
jgi:plasmid maintenance system antidote protein VapI